MRSRDIKLGPLYVLNERDYRTDSAEVMRGIVLDTTGRFMIGIDGRAIYRSEPLTGPNRPTTLVAFESVSRPLIPRGGIDVTDAVKGVRYPGWYYGMISPRDVFDTWEQYAFRHEAWRARKAQVALEEEKHSREERRGLRARASKFGVVVSTDDRTASLSLDDLDILLTRAERAV